MMNLSGSMTALITPFKNGKVDAAALRRQIEDQIKGGTSALIPCGTTGESPTLSHAEHKDVIAITVEAAAGRVPVIAGTGSNSTDEAIELTRFAKKAGAKASLSVVPYYNKPTQKGMYEHFKAIAKSAGLPIVLYNIPGRCGAGLTAGTIADLAKIDLVVAVKEATGSMDMASEIIGRTDLAVLSGDDSLTLPILALGGKGVISVFANLYPAHLSAMVRDFFDGDLDEARKLHYAMLPLCKALFIETNPIPVKTAMRIVRRDTGDLRLPLTPMETGNEAALKSAVAAFEAYLAPGGTRGGRGAGKGGRS
jgi:4-hydroxy-tetrahydrodipicolinate synthase